MSSIFLYIITIILLAACYVKDKEKTKSALKKSAKSFENILPEFLGVIMLIGVVLAVMDPALISRLLGGKSGWLGVIISSVIGAVTLIPGFIAFPMAAMLLQGGAGYMQMGAFISSLMMVGVVTAPIEIKYFGRRLTIYRNLLAFLFSFVAAFIIGKVMSWG